MSPNLILKMNHKANLPACKLSKVPVSPSLLHHEILHNTWNCFRLLSAAKNIPEQQSQKKGTKSRMFDVNVFGFIKGWSHPCIPFGTKLEQLVLLNELYESNFIFILLPLTPSLSPALMIFSKRKLLFRKMKIKKFDVVSRWAQVKFFAPK